MDSNYGMPELAKLEEVVGQYDFLVQEGIIYSKGQKKRAEELITALKKLVKSLIVNNV